MANSKAFLDALSRRRSIYSISKASPLTDEQIQELIAQTIKHTPSAFNSQTTRIVLLLGEQHDKLWNITTEVLRAIVPAENFESTAQKMEGFKAGYGTVLFFEDQAVVEGLQQKFPTYQEKFPEWSEHTSAMHQLVVWTALELEGYGANLQHYNPLVDEKVKSEWGLPETWRLIAQMPFGKAEGSPGNKDFQPVEERFNVFK